VLLGALIASGASQVEARSLNGAPGAALLRRVGDGGTVGASLADLPPDTVGLRYHLRVNASSGHINRKLIFVGVGTSTPGGSGSGIMETDVVTDWLQYTDDLGHAGWPEQGIPHPSEPSLSLRNIDYGGVGRVGLRPTSAAGRLLFPRQCAGIDRVTPEHASITSIAAIHQGSILGRDFELTFRREPLTTLQAQRGWGHRFTPAGDVTPVLPAGTYWPWRLTVRPFREPSMDFVFLLDESRGRYISGVSIVTEFFFRPDVPQNLLGVQQLFVWGAETLRESATTWERRPRWEFTTDITPHEPSVGYGFRKAIYAGHQVLEVSYSGDDAYLRAGSVIDLDGRR
jgi:hypothetical protein